MLGWLGQSHKIKITLRTLANALPMWYQKNTPLRIAFLSQNIQVDAIVLDFRKGVDTLSLRKLILKLKIFLLNVNIIKWIKA